MKGGAGTKDVAARKEAAWKRAHEVKRWAQQIVDKHGNSLPTFTDVLWKPVPDEIERDVYFAAHKLGYERKQKKAADQKK